MTGKYFRTEIALGSLFVVTFSALILAILILVFGGNISTLFLIAFYAAIITMIDYQKGIIFAVFLLPFSATQIIPRGLFGIIGLNPLNAILIITFFSMIMASILYRIKYYLPLPFPFLLYIIMFVSGALIGSFQVGQGSVISDIGDQFDRLTIVGYFLAQFVKPIIILVVGWLIGISITNNGSRIKEGRVYIYVLALCCIIYFLIMMNYLLLPEVSYSTLASARTKMFFRGLGIHANELGLMTNMFFALMLYAALHSENKWTRRYFFAAACLAAFTAANTFSRSAFLGIIVIGSYYFLSCKKFKQFLIGLAIVIVAAIFLPEAFWDRALTGFETGDTYKVTAGRLDDIWRPLFPWALESPIIGHGLGSTLWAPPRLNGTMPPVGHPHSAYLGVFLDFGLLGIVIVGLFFLSMWRLFRKLMRNHPDNFWQGVFEGGSVCLLVLFVQAFTDDRFIPTNNQVVLWIIYGIALAHEIKLRIT